jgi:hypothetical protein
MLAVLSVFILSIGTFAQPKLSPKERAKALSEKLSLTKDQTTKVEKILTDAQGQMKNMQDRSEFRKVMVETNTKIENLLTDKQKVAYKKMQEDMRNQRKNNLQDNKSDKPGNN